MLKGEFFAIEKSPKQVGESFLWTVGITEAGEHRRPFPIVWQATQRRQI